MSTEMRGVRVPATDRGGDICKLIGRGNNILAGALFFFFFLQKGTAWITYLGTCCILIHHLTIDEHRCEIDLLNQRCTTE